MMINYIKGNAVEPIGKGKKAIVHICNNIGLWGAGFVLAVSRKWPKTKIEFKSKEFKLGDIQIIEVEKDIVVINMIAQNGIFSRDNLVPINYDALKKCLKQVNEFAYFNDYSVHMPKIGTGLAKGKWEIIEEIINDRLRDTIVNVYELF